MKLALIQEKQNRLYNFKNQELKFEDEEIYDLQREMIEQNLILLRQVDEEKADLVLTSEAINFPGQPFRYKISPKKVIGETQDYLMESCSKIARQKNIYLVVGMFRLKQDGNLYNSAIVFDRRGKMIFSYDKNFLAGDEKEYLTSGKNFPVWESEFGKIGIGICWDMQFPETARSYARQKVDLILCPTWGWERIYGHSRAYENGIYIAATMAAPFGKNIEGKRTPSEVVAPDGRVLARGVRDGKDIVYCDLGDIRDCEQLRKLRIDDLENWLE